MSPQSHAQQLLCALARQTLLRARRGVRVRWRAALEPLPRRVLLAAAPAGMEQPTALPVPQYQHAVSREVVFVDAQVGDMQPLLDDLRTQIGTGRALEVVVLDRRRDGIEQITAALNRRRDIDAVHIISHGATGAIQLGDGWLTRNDLTRRQGQLRSWREALSAQADILLYGCDVAGNKAGREFLAGLAAMTGADVAGSTNDTGHARLGADWVLERATGRIETRIAFGELLRQNWTHALNVAVDSTSTGSTKDQTSLTISHTTSGANRLMLVSLAMDPHGASGSSVTYNGANLAFVGAEEQSGSHSRIELWALVAPATGMHNVVVNTTGGGFNGMVVGVMTFTGVNQTTPLLNFTAASGSSTNASVTVSSQLNDLVFAAVHSHNGSAVTPGSGQTEHWDLFNDQSNGSGTTKSGAASVANSWTVNSDDWSAIAVSVQAATNFTQVASLSPTQDSYIRLSSPAANSGFSGSMIVDRETTDLQRALVQFDLSAIPAGSTIGSAKLKLQATQSGGSLTVEAYRLMQAWSEGSVTWNDRSSGSAWSSAGGTLSTTAADSVLTITIGEHTFDLTALVQEWVTGSAPNYGVLLSSPDGGDNRTVTYSTREGTLRPALEITYTPPLNNAPVLDSSRSPALSAVSEDAGAPSGADGTLVSSLIDFATPAGQLDNVTDPDAGAQLGIAVTAADSTSGAWYFSIDNGANWNPLGSVAENNARLLAADANTRLYFRPGATFNGTVTNAITFRAWDRTTGIAGGTADTTTHGGTTDFSSSTDVASIVITPMNDAPVNQVPAAQSIQEDTGLTFSSGNGNAISVSDIDGGGNDLRVTLSVTTGSLTLASLAGLSFTAGDGVTDGSMTFTGAPSAVNAAMDGMIFTPASNANGSVQFSITSDDQGSTGSGGTQSDSDTVAITVSAVNDAPVNALPPSQSVAGGGVLNLGASSGASISIVDIDAGSSDVQVTLAASVGTLTLASTSGLTFTTGDGNDDATMTFRGAIAAINTALDGMQYNAPLILLGDAQIDITTSDLGNSGAGGAQSDWDTLVIGAAPTNQPPVNVTPAAQSMFEDGNLVFSTAGGNSITVTDPDAGGNAIRVTLSATNGRLTLSDDAGVTIVSGANGSASVSFTGTLSAINAALNGLVFTPVANFSGAAALQIATDDQGNSGAGGARTDASTVSISVATVNDAPIVQSPAAQTINEDSPLIFSAANGNAITISDIDAGSSLVQLSLAASDGVLTLADVSGLTFITGDGTSDATIKMQGTVAAINAALDGMIYAPAVNANGAVTLGVVVDDLGGTGSGGAHSAGEVVSITVNAVNDLPAVNAPTAQNIVEDGTLVFSAGNGNLISLSDVDALNGNVWLGLTGSSALTLASTAGLTFSLGDGTDDAVIVVTGTLSALNAALAGMTFTPVADFAGAASIAVSVNDLGNSGSGVALSAAQNITINVAAANDAPVNVLPPTQTIVEDHSLVFSAANGNQISVADVDADGDLLRISLTSSRGTMTLNGTNGLTFITGDGSGDATMTFDGTLADINAALDGLTFVPVANYFGSADIRINTDDLGHHPGPGLIDNDNVSIIIAADNDPPGSSGIGDISVSEDAAPTVLELPSYFSDVEDAALDLVLLSNSSPSLFSALSLNVATGELTLQYAPDAFGVTAITIRALDSGGLFVDVTFNVTVNPVNDAPALAANLPLAVQEGEAKAIGSDLLRLSDVDDPAAQLRFVVTALPQRGTITLNGATLAMGDSFTQADVDAGRVSYSSIAGQPGTDGFAFSADDGSGGALPASTFNITINALPPTNEPDPGEPDPVDPEPPDPVDPLDPPTTEGPLMAPPPALPAPPAIQNEPPLDGQPTDDEPETSQVTTPPLPALPRTGGGGAGGSGGGASAANDAAASHEPSLAPPSQTEPEPSVPEPAPAQPTPIAVAPPVVVAPPPSGPPPAAMQPPPPALPPEPVAFVAAPGQFWKELDQLTEEVAGEVNIGRLLAGTASFVSLGASVLYILWMIRAGYLLASLLSSMPAWQFVDPLPILNDPSLFDRRRRATQTGDDDDDSLQTLVDRPCTSGAVS